MCSILGLFDTTPGVDLTPCARWRWPCLRASAIVAPTGRACTPSRAACWCTSASPSWTPRAARSRCCSPDGAPGAGGERRDLQPPRTRARIVEALRLPDRLGLRGDQRAVPANMAPPAWPGSTASTPSRSGMRAQGRYLIARDPLGVCPLVLGPRRRRPPVGGFGNEGARAPLPGRGAVSARACVRQRDGQAGVRSTQRAWRDYDAVAGASGRTRSAARRLRAGRAPAADDRRALRRAAVGRPGLVAGRGLRRALRPPARRGRRPRRSLVAAPALASRSAWKARPTSPRRKWRRRRWAPCTTASPTASRKASTRCPT